MERTTTPTERLADLLLGEQGPLERFIRTRRAKGVSWRRISLELRDVTNREIDVTYETLRSWYPDAPSERAS